VPLKQNKALAESLAKVPVGVEIPSELWGAMAEILVQLYLLDQQKQAR
jgi:type III secretion system FlhB-like substrate exporter